MQEQASLGVMVKLIACLFANWQMVKIVLTKTKFLKKHNLYHCNLQV